MKKTMRRLGTLALAAMMTLGMTATALADETVTNDLTINKQIVISNPEGSSVYGPAVTYTYTLTAARAGAIVNDGTSAAVVKAGKLEAADETVKTVTFTNDETVAAAAEGTVIAGSAAFTFDAAKFGAAGVYRYMITETAPENFDAVGLTREDTYNPVRFLDVYVKNGEEGLEIYGYILFEGTENDGMTATSAKSDGYTEDEAQENVDTFKTSNLTVSKTIAGTLADMTNKFPFEVKIDSETITSGKFLVNGETTDFDGSYVNGALAEDSTLALGNGDQIVLTGIPVGNAATAYTANEFNNTPDTYKVSGAYDGEIKAGEATGVEAEALSADAAATAAFTNTLDAVSPTGVILRFAPYALMLGAGVAFLMISRRRRSEEEI